MSSSVEKITPNEQAEQAEFQALLHTGVNLLLRCHSLIQLMKFNIDSVEELCKAFFITIQSPEKVILFLNQNIDNQEIIQSIFNEFKKKDGYYLYEEPERIKIIPQLFRQILLNLSTFDWGNLPCETQGLIFETFIHKVQKQSVYSVSNTQIVHSLLDYVITVLDPKKGEWIADPRLGEGTFLRKVYQYTHQNPMNDFNVLTKKNVLSAADQPTHFTLAKRLIWMYGVKPTDIKMITYNNKNKFTNVEGMIYGTFDIVFADLVGLWATGYDASDTTKIDLLHLQHCINLLKDGGRMSIFIKDERFASANFAAIRKIESHGKLLKITALPKEAYAHASFQIIIVFFQKYTSEEKKQYDLNPMVDYKMTYAEITKVGKSVTLFDAYDITQNQLLLLSKEYKSYLTDGEIKNQILLEVANYSKIANWNLAYQKRLVFEKIKTYSYKKLSELLILNENYTILQDQTLYKRVKVRLYNKGVELRDEVMGVYIKTKRQVKIEKGQLIIAKLNAASSAVGLVPDALQDAIITSDFLAYTIKTDIILPQYLEFLIASQPFSIYLNHITTGFTMERLNKSLFLNIEIPIPTLEEQILLCKKMIHLRHQMEEIKQNFEAEKKIFENKLFKI